MSRHWYKPTFWRWWWATSAPTGAKALAAMLITAGVIFAGYELTGVFSSAQAAQTYTYVQTVRQVRVAHVTDVQPTTVLEHGRIVTVDPPPKTVFTPPVQQLVTITTSHVQDRTQTQTRTETVPVTQSRFTTVIGPGHTVEVTQTAAPVTRTATVSHTITRSQTVTAQQTSPGQTVVSERTVTETNPVTTTVTKSTTVPVTSTVSNTVTHTTTVTNTATQTVTHPTTETVTVATTTTVPVTTTVTHTVTSLVTVTSPVTVTVKTST
jgi:hypothetical protein